MYRPQQNIGFVGRSINVPQPQQKIGKKLTGTKDLSFFINLTKCFRDHAKLTYILSFTLTLTSFTDAQFTVFILERYEEKQSRHRSSESKQNLADVFGRKERASQ